MRAGKLRVTTSESEMMCWISQIPRYASILVMLSLTSCGEVNGPLGSKGAEELLRSGIEFVPTEAKLLYSWHNCCKSEEPFGGTWPGSKCSVYQLGESDFERVANSSYPKVNWRTIDTACLGSGGGKYPMKGCSEFPAKKLFGRDLNFVLHGEICRSDTGRRLKIDVDNRVVMVEQYFYE